MEGKIAVRRAAASLLACWCLAAGPACREIIDYDDGSPPGSRVSIVWERTNGLAGEAILALRVDQTGILYAGTESGKIFRSVTDGNDWSPVLLPTADGAITAIITDPLRRIFVANDIHGVFESIDAGVSWSPINGGLEDTAIYALAYLPSGALVAGSARGDVSVTGSGVPIWSRKFSFARTVTSLLVLSSEEIYAAAWSAGIYRFGELGAAAEAVNAGLQDLYVNALHSGASGYLFAGTRTGGVFRSDLGDIFWQNTGGGSISREVIAFRTSQYNELFAGTGTGIFISADAGLHWTKLDAGIGSQEVRALAINGNATVFAGTIDGVYRSIRLDPGGTLARVPQAAFLPR